MIREALASARLDGETRCFEPIGAGSKVKFIAHGETGLPYTVITREGDDCTLCDARGRMLEHVPFELLVLVPGEPKLSAIRGVDELRFPDAQSASHSADAFRAAGYEVETHSTEYAPGTDWQAVKT